MVSTTGELETRDFEKGVRVCRPAIIERRIWDDQARTYRWESVTEPLEFGLTQAPREKIHPTIAIRFNGHVRLCEEVADGWYDRSILLNDEPHPFYRFGPQLAPAEAQEVARSIGLTQFRQV